LPKYNNIAAVASNINGRYQNLANLSLLRIKNLSLLTRWVKLIVVTNMTEINPEHTDSSKTAARGEFSLNIITASIALVMASPTTDLISLIVTTVHNAESNNRTINVIFNAIA
jgi:hypothetical protein